MEQIASTDIPGDDRRPLADHLVTHLRSPDLRHTLEPGDGVAKRLHVTHAVIALDVGGLERIVVDLVRAGVACGQRVSVLCLARPGTLAPAATNAGAEVVCAGQPPRMRPGLVSELMRLLRRLRPDVLHTHQIGALLYAGAAARRARIPVVVHTEHGKHYWASWRRRLVGRLAGRYARRFFCVSSDIFRDVRAMGLVPPGRARIVPNGIDVARFTGQSPAGLRQELGLPEHARVIGTVGRLTEVKRHDVLLRGFARIAARHPTVRLLVVGDGPRRGELADLAHSLGVSGRVVFARYRERPEQLLPLFDVFALTSQSEGMPLAILEAWAAGKPVVASAVGGVPELIADGVTGLLFPSGDAEALANRLDRLLGDDPLARALGAAGLSVVTERYDVQVMADAYARSYRELLAGCTRSRQLVGDS